MVVKKLREAYNRVIDIIKDDEFQKEIKGTSKYIDAFITGLHLWENKDIYGKRPEDKELIIFVKTILKCFQSSIERSGLDDPVFTEDMLKPLLEKSLLSRIKDEKWNKYLPDFPPIRKFQNIVEEILIKNEISEEQINQLILDFRLKIEGLVEETNDDSFLKYFRLWTKGDEESQLQEHLERMRILCDFRLGGKDDIPLKSYYVEPRSIFLEGKEWKSNISEKKDIKKARIAIDDYFKKKYYQRKTRINVEYPILFIGADFGIGKSSLLRMYAKELADNFIDKRKGLIPVYIMFRDFSGNLSNLKNELESYDFMGNRPKTYLLDALDESGSLSFEQIKDLLSYLESFKDSKDTRVIVTSRLVSKREISAFITNTLGNKYLRLLGFDNKQVDEWYKKSGVPDINYKYLKEIKLGKEEIEKPLFLWLIKNLKKEDAFKDLIEINRTILYLLFINSITNKAKLRSTIEAEEMHEEIDHENLEAKARHILRQLASIRQFVPDAKDGLNMEIISNYLDDVDRKIFENELGDQKFLVLSYFGYRAKSNLEFTHQTFREFLLAEYYLEILICSLTKRQYVQEKIKLGLGVPTIETIVFLKDLMSIVVKSQKDPEARKLITPLLEGCIAADNNLLHKFDRNDDGLYASHEMIMKLVDIAFEWFLDQRVIIPTFGSTINEWQHSLQKINFVDFPHNFVFSYIYVERWLALFLMKNMYGETTGKNILIECRDQYTSYDVAFLIRDSRKNFRNYIYLGLGDLSGVFLENMALSVTRISNINLKNTVLSHLSMYCSFIIKGDFQSAKITGTTLSNSVLQDCIFRKSLLTDTNFDQAFLLRADFRGATLHQCSFYNADLRQSDFRDVVFKEIDVTGADFEESKINNTDFRDYLFANGARNVPELWTEDIDGEDN